MSNCCGCMITSTAGIVSGKSPFEELEELLDKLKARKDVYLAFVLKWDTVSDIDSWMIEPDGTAIGYSTPYKEKLDGINSFNYVLEAAETSVNKNDPKLSPNKGNLDKDCISCSPVGIENLVYFWQSEMGDGLYQYRIDDFSGEHPNGFKVYIIARNTRLEPVGYAELEWEGRFKHERLQRDSQNMVHLCKQGENLTFKIMHPHLKLRESNGLNWITGNLNCSRASAGTTSESPSTSPARQPVISWRVDSVGRKTFTNEQGRASGNLIFYGGLRVDYVLRKYVDGNATSETREYSKDYSSSSRWVYPQDSTDNAYNGIQNKLNIGDVINV